MNSKLLKQCHWMLCCLLCWSCDNSIDTIKDYYQYLNNKENGLVQEKKIGALSFAVKYLPTDFLLYRNHSQAGVMVKDSLYDSYASSLNFMLKISPSEDAPESFDVMTETVSSLEAFKQHAFTMNFALQELIHLKIGNKEIKPVLVETENIYGLQQYRLVNIVFAKEHLEELDEEGSNWDVVFKDELYGTGLHHFVFDKKDLKNIPKLNI